MAKFGLSSAIHSPMGRNALGATRYGMPSIKGPSVHIGMKIGGGKFGGYKGNSRGGRGGGLGGGLFNGAGVGGIGGK